MKEARETWPDKGRGADGGDRGSLPPFPAKCSGFLKHPQILKTSPFDTCIQPAQGQTLQVDLFV